MFAYFCVAVGGALGSLGRFWLSGWVANRFGSEFPWGTLVINVTALAAPAFRQFFMIGICGGYTTFSSFSLETLKRAQGGQWLYAGGNVILSVVLCLVAVWLGYVLGAMFNSMKGH